MLESGLFLDLPSSMRSQVGWSCALLEEEWRFERAWDEMMGLWNRGNGVSKCVRRGAMMLLLIGCLVSLIAWSMDYALCENAWQRTGVDLSFL